VRENKERSKTLTTENTRSPRKQRRQYTTGRKAPEKAPMRQKRKPDNKMKQTRVNKLALTGGRIQKILSSPHSFKQQLLRAMRLNEWRDGRINKTKEIKMKN